MERAYAIKNGICVVYKEYYDTKSFIGKETIEPFFSLVAFIRIFSANFQAPREDLLSKCSARVKKLRPAKKEESCSSVESKLARPSIVSIGE